jgi:hypothetical protein
MPGKDRSFVRIASFAWLIGTAALLVGWLAAGPASVQAQQRQGFTFALIGDLGYYPQQEPWVDNVFADMNKDPALAFVVHVGDLSRPVHACTDATLTRRLAQFQGSDHPLVFTPGDNDWTDCHDKQGVKGGNPIVQLDKLRTMFFRGEQSLGKRTMPLLRQSNDPQFAKFRENARWDMAGVTFVTLHVTGSNNNHGRTPEGDAEYAERNKANLAWLAQAFAHATANNSRAVMVLQQANLFPEITPFPGARDKVSGLADIRAALEKETIAFRKPVVLVHGDSHFFRIDNAFFKRPPRGSPGVPAPENFTRVETFGTPNHHWLHVTVDPDDPNVFTFRPRIVRANVVNRP